MTFRMLGGTQLSSSMRASMQQLENMPSWVHMQAGNAAVRNIRSVAPVKTGFMRNSIRARSTRQGAEIFCDAYYWRFVNFGTVNIRPRRFVERGLNMSSKEVRDVYKAELQRAVRGVRGI